MKTIIPHSFAVLLIIGMVIYFPHATINPGKLLSGHGEVKEDCLACHSPFRGASTEKCKVCHKPAEIGRVTVAGAPLVQKEDKTLFHKNLGNIDCISCHSEHNGPDGDRLTRRFSHDFLDDGIRKDCAACHLNRKPQDQLHTRVGENCADCHAVAGWRPAEFDHNRLAVPLQGQCAECHLANRPDDALHRQVQQNCGTCHTTSAWKPATFEHDKYFRFDRHHPADCRSCHANSQNYSQYTCYGCHEHSRARIAEKHQKEGIWQFEDCVRCHRSGDKHEAEQKIRNQGSERERKKDRDHREDEGREHD